MMRRIIYDYDSPHIVGREKRSFSVAKIVIGIIIATLIIALVYIVFFRCEHVKYECKEYFTVVSSQFPDRASAERSAQEISSRGGAGYINESDTAEVVVSVYMNEEDALAIAGRYGYMVKSTGKFSVELEASEAEMIEVLSMCETLIEEVYRVSVSVDKGEISLSAAVYALGSLKDIYSETAVAWGETDESFKSDKHYECVSTMLGELGGVVETFDTISDGSRLKYCLCRVTFIYIKLLKAIS